MKMPNGFYGGSGALCNLMNDKRINNPTFIVEPMDNAVSAVYFLMHRN
jgi:hypothetical protein